MAAKGLWVVLNVENVDKSLEFYKLLGLKTKAETMEQMKWGNVTLSDDSGLIIWNRRSVGPNQDQPDLQAWLSGELGKGVLLTVGVANAQRVWDKVSSLVPIDQPIREEPWGGKSFNVVDPDGYVIAISDKFAEASPTRRSAVKKVKRAVKRTVAKAKRVVAKGKAKRKGR